MYFDDCILACKDEQTAKVELDKIHKTHPLTVIQCNPTDDGGIAFDMTGSDIMYNATKRKMSISMSNFINKVQGPCSCLLVSNVARFLYSMIKTCQ